MILGILSSALRVSTPLIFAALGGLLCERAGVINIALEGMMLIGAFAGAVFTVVTHSPWIGFAAAGGAGIIFAALYAACVIPLRADQIVAGTAINFLAFGITPFVCKILYDVTGSTPQIPLAERFEIAPVVFAWVLVVLVLLFLRTSKWGLWLSFAGEHPEALSTAGVRVNAVRWCAVLMGGALAGMGGATLSVFLSSSFSRNMTAGRGFIALAALISGRWRPVPTAVACVVFGFAEAVQIRLQGVQLWGHVKVPVQFIQMLPYVVTILILAGMMGRSRAPSALGTPWRNS
jgi:simple sugar transport system permease protein